VTTPEERERFRRAVAERSGVDISPGAIWALIRIDEHGFAQARAMALEGGVRPTRITEVLDELRRRGLLAGEDGGVQVTPAGTEETRRVVGARRELLTEALADENADRRPEVSALLTRLARELCGEPPSARADAAPAVLA
jgi:DNA-binding MarR family transcriptional regulator